MKHPRFVLNVFRLLQLTTDASVSQIDASRSESWTAGADGYSEGWMVVLWHPVTGTIRRRTVKDVESLLSLPEAPAILGVDMVIGCPDTAEPGGRVCDRNARRLLGHPRGAAVFSPPARSALGATTYEHALRRNRASGPNAPGLSKQAFHLFPKIRALTQRITPGRQNRIREVHPELSFYALNGNAPVEASKHSEEGRRTRMALLATNGFSDIPDALENWAGGPVGADDVLDAHAVCWTARRILEDRAQRCPPKDQDAPRNARGLRMEIWR